MLLALSSLLTSALTLNPSILAAERASRLCPDTLKIMPHKDLSSDLLKLMDYLDVRRMKVL